MTATAIACAAMMRVADRIESVECELTEARKVRDSDRVALLQQQLETLARELESAWDQWNDELLAARLSQV